MKIRLNDQYTASLLPGSRKISVQLEAGIRYFDNVSDLVESVAMDIISRQAGEMTLSEYQRQIVLLSNELFEGVVEYEN